MGFEHLDETLPDHSGRTKNSDWDFLGHVRVENSSYITSPEADDVQQPDF
jgi:hypothetical protein